ncbi:MAG: GDSL-type esterase/lipase family protein [Chloroflexota bacterium]
MKTLEKNALIQTQSFHAHFPISTSDVIFLGDTQIKDFRWSDSLDEVSARNLGIENETTNELFQRLESIVSQQPRLIFLQSGGSDVRQGYRLRTTRQAYQKVLTTIRQRSPQTTLVVQSILPQGRVQATRIQSLNRSIAHWVEASGGIYVDLYTHLANAHGVLDSQYSRDEYLLLAPGYEYWLRSIKPYTSLERSCTDS